ncbi:MAG: hypothetical protein HQ594_00890 [Candidatus Omnitrophica bacterium]|nr:hypothetical protein [Candidatus Omnitrophota bacterium]
MVLLKTGSDAKIEKLKPNRDLMEFTRIILNQNTMILRMNGRLLELLLSPVCYCGDFGKKNLSGLKDLIKDK